jgi:hypothetical protein
MPAIRLNQSIAINSDCLNRARAGNSRASSSIPWVFLEGDTRRKIGSFSLAINPPKSPDLPLQTCPPKAPTSNTSNRARSKSFCPPTRPRQAPVKLNLSLRFPALCELAGRRVFTANQIRASLQRQKLNYLNPPRDFGFVLQIGRPGLPESEMTGARFCFFYVWLTQTAPGPTAIRVNELRASGLQGWPS